MEGPKEAIVFLRKKVWEGSIGTARIAVVGGSAGTMIAENMVFGDKKITVVGI
jgi:acetyl esterase/lipase